MSGDRTGLTPQPASAEGERSPDPHPDGVTGSPMGSGGSAAQDGLKTGGTPAPTARSPDGGDRGTFKVPVELALLGAVITAALPALATFFGIVFDLFPALTPEAPIEVRGVTVGEVSLAERNSDRGDGRWVNVVLFEIEAVGYDADTIAYTTLTLDAATRERLPEQGEESGVLDLDTRTDRVVIRLDVPPPGTSPGCVVLRVLLFPGAGVEGGLLTQPDAMPFLLDYADTAPFDPYDPSCPDGAAVGPAPA